MRPSGKAARQCVVGTFAEIFKRPEKPEIVVVDIPIGLLNKSPCKGRTAEKIARQLLKGRRSSVFRVPSRKAVYCAADNKKIPNDKTRYRKACSIARATSVDSKAFALQGFYICDKIVEVDKYLRRNTKVRKAVFESHPELAFWRLNDETALAHPKKHPQGIKKRKKLLLDAKIPLDLIEARPPKKAKPDDALDSLVCLVVARRIHRKQARSFPDPAPPDPFGLPMAIWA